MGNFKLGFALTILYFFESISGIQSQNSHPHFNYFVVSQQWPQTNCFELNKIWQEADATCTACRIPNHWTLHGLWPSNRGHSSLSDCKTDITFKPNLLSSNLKVQLNDKWRNNRINSKNNYGFWGYEWRKHGSCALGAERTNSLPKYFSAAVRLLDEHNVGQILERDQIISGRKYNFFAIYYAIRAALKVNVHIMCIRNPITKEQYLHEVRVCVDTSFNLIDCNDDKHISNCDYKNSVVYPKTLKTC